MTAPILQVVEAAEQRDQWRGKPFRKTERQAEACVHLNSNRHVLLDGGSRSGKTFLIVRNVFLRAVKRSSRHLLVRYRYNHARVSLGHDTIPNVLAACFPGLPVRENKADGYWVVPAAGGGESQVWLGGTDDRERAEKVLGSEFSTIFFNECSQVPFDVIPTFWTRLAEKSGLAQRCYYDSNPPGIKHWTRRLFYDKVLPTGEAWDAKSAVFKMNPADNAENLDPDYLKSLASLPRRQRLRFLEGQYLADVEGALWTDQMIVRAKLREPGTIRRTVVAVDPSVSHSATSDECGILVCSEDQHPDQQPGGVVHGDFSGKFSTRDWAQRVVALYHSYGANEVVAEKNQGGDLVRDAIHGVDRDVRVELVHASKGKDVRAEPVSMLYEQGRVSHLRPEPELEAELTEWVPRGPDRSGFSPNRLDALVWGFTRLLVGQQRTRFHVG